MILKNVQLPIELNVDRSKDVEKVCKNITNAFPGKVTVAQKEGRFIINDHFIFFRNGRNIEFDDELYLYSNIENMGNWIINYYKEQFEKQKAAS